MMAKKKSVAIDLFCGVGGMSLGFKQAGFRIVGAFDNEPRHIRAYKRNFAGIPAMNVDLSSWSGQDLVRAIDSCDSEIDVVFGGPPCQGFSVGGKRSLDDERNLLVYDFSRLVRQIEPKYFVLENVQGLLIGHARAVVESFCRRIRRAGYKVLEPIRALNAADFGVPQRRRRTFIIGCRTDMALPDYPEATPLVDENGTPYFPTVWDAISDLPNIDCRNELFERDEYKGSLGVPTHYAKLMRSELKEVSDRLPQRHANGHALTGCLRTRHSAAVVARFRATSPGMAEPISRYLRLHCDQVAPTIRAGTDVDHGKHTSPRPIHPKLPRCITVREAARLHSYPDWFQFDPTRWHAFRQLGNSVPPRLARFVARSVLHALARAEQSKD